MVASNNQVLIRRSEISREKQIIGQPSLIRADGDNIEVEEEKIESERESE